MATSTRKYDSRRGISSTVLKRLRRQPWAMAGLFTLSIIFLIVTLAPLSPYDPEQSDISEKLQPPTIYHPMGTDALGRDVMTRVLYGGRLSLVIGIGATVVSTIIGVSIGLTAGLNGGWIDSVLMRTGDVFISFPTVFVFILLAAMFRDLGIGLAGSVQPFLVILAIGSLSWMYLARLIRVSTLSLREKEFVTAAYCLGASKFRIVLAHILPNTASIIIVATTLQIANAMLIESGLSFIGFGIHPRTPTWGNMLGDGQKYIIRYPWITIFPSIMVFLTVISINVVGDGLRSAIEGKGAPFMKAGELKKR